MSKLENEDYIFCSCCSARMFDILLCSNKSRRNDMEGLPVLLRCNSLVCEHCKYCYYCRQRYNQLKEELVRNRIGRPDQTPECKNVLVKMRDDFNKDWL